MHKGTFFLSFYIHVQTLGGAHGKSLSDMVCFLVVLLIVFCLIEIECPFFRLDRG